MGCCWFRWLGGVKIRVMAFAAVLGGFNTGLPHPCFRPLGGLQISGVSLAWFESTLIYSENSLVSSAATVLKIALRV